jgi:phenylpyruvate tautomerase PptA (4-oxalocrotonate tautomerase family)
VPVFHAHLSKGRFSSDDKRSLADALNRALHEALGTPMDDRFIIISEHGEDELFIHPTFPDLERTTRRIVVTVIFGNTRTVEQKRRLAQLVTRYTVDDVGVGEDDVMLMMLPVPLSNMSFGRGVLMSDIDLPWTRQDPAG